MGVPILELPVAAGSSPAETGASPLARRAVLNWCRRHAKGGDAAVASGRRTVRPGEPAPLTRQQELDLLETLRDSYPDDHGLPGHLWNRQALADLIHRRCGIRLAMRAVNRQLKIWGLGPRTPAERACSLCVAAVVAWLTRDYPLIMRSARASGAQVCWAGRTRLAGVSPAAQVVSAVTTRGSLRFAVLSGRADAPLPPALLARLAAHEQRRVQVIMDGSFAPADWPRRLPDGVVLHPMPSCARSPN
jgi:transposase